LEAHTHRGIEQATILAARLRDAGIDLLDVSSGGNDPRGVYKIKPGYQVDFAAHIKKNVPGLLIGAVGLLTDAQQSEEILEKGDADVVLYGREVLRNIDFPMKAAEQLEYAVYTAPQYERAWGRMTRPASTHKVAKESAL
jgi:2,4-dienoyl-CoA reductase-like NADH-dependent reductase (Old Yellow Enzyme family)